tara:strand:- start:80 stop:367 length:288 start_codon:yes stop_codon:yes gene_type:complete
MLYIPLLAIYFFIIFQTVSMWGKISGPGELSKAAKKKTWETISWKFKKTIIAFFFGFIIEKEIKGSFWALDESVLALLSLIVLGNGFIIAITRKK